MQPALPYYPNMDKKLAVDHTAHLEDELLHLIKQFDSIELITRLVSLAIVDGYLLKTKIEIFTEVPGLHYIIDLCLRSKNNSRKVPSLVDVETIMNLLDHYFKSLKPSVIGDIYYNDSDLEMLIFTTRMKAMLSSINRERYIFQQNDQLVNLYPKLDQHFEKEFGFTISDCMQFSKAIWDDFTQSTNKKIDEAYEKILGSGCSKEEKNDFFQKTSSSEIDFVRLATEIDKSFSSPKHMHLFKVSKFCKKHNFSPTRFKKYLKYFSCKFGDNIKNSNSPFGEFFINYKPLILLNSNQFFSPLPELIFSNFHVIVEKIIADNKNYNPKMWHKLEKIKKNYVEDRIISYISRLFPSSKIYRNVFYNFEGERPEVDVLVDFDDKILIFEAKAGSFTPPAKFGRKDRLTTDLQKLTEKAFFQSSRTRRYLQSTKLARFEDNKKREVLRIENSDQRKIFQINVTLEHLGSLATILAYLKPLGLFKNNEYPWSVYLYDLDVITDILDYPSLFIHYIEQRMQSQDDEIFSHDEEIQLFSWYLLNANLQPFGWKTKNKSLYLVLTPHSYEKFDLYYNHNGPKPKIDLKKNIIKKIQKLEKKQEYGYTNTISTILNERIQKSPFRK